MDKLEKALEKARQQRGTSAPAHAVPNSPNAAITSVSGPTVFPSSQGEATISQMDMENHRIIAYQTRSGGADLFRILRTQVLQAMSKSNLKTIAITSPNYSDGKTTIALNLAISIALDLKQTVLLVDLDLRKPSVHEYLGITSEYGLTDYLLHDTPIADCMVRLPFDRLSVLPAGKLTDHSSETLGSPKMAALARELKSRYPDRFIIYDMPPILAQDDPNAFMPNVDAALLVIKDGYTKVSEIKRSLNALNETLVIGTVLNSVD